MNGKVKWTVDANGAVQITVQRQLELMPVTFTLSPDSVELMYCQVLNVRVKAKQDAQSRVLRT